MLAISTSQLLMPEELSDSQREAALAYGCRTSQFAEGDLFRIWAAGPVSHCQVYDRASKSNKDVGSENGVSHVLLITKDTDEASPTEWATTSIVGLGEFQYPKPEKCVLYPIKQLITPYKGYRMEPDVNWQGEFQFAQGLCFPHHIPDAVQIFKGMPRGIMDLLQNPQYLVPRDFFTSLNLGAELFKKNFSKFEVSATGAITAELIPTPLSLFDHEACLNKMIKESKKTWNGHPYIVVRIHYSEDQYRINWRGQLWDANSRRTLVLVD